MHSQLKWYQKVQIVVIRWGSEDKQNPTGCAKVQQFDNSTFLTPKEQRTFRIRTIDFPTQIGAQKFFLLSNFRTNVSQLVAFIWTRARSLQSLHNIPQRESFMCAFTNYSVASYCVYALLAHMACTTKKRSLTNLTLTQFPPCHLLCTMRCDVWWGAAAHFFCDCILYSTTTL